MLILVLLSRDGTFQGIYKFSTYYDFLNNRSKDHYGYRLYEEVGENNLKCIKEKL